MSMLLLIDMLDSCRSKRTTQPSIRWYSDGKNNSAFSWTIFCEPLEFANFSEQLSPTRVFAMVAIDSMMVSVQFGPSFFPKRKNLSPRGMSQQSWPLCERNEKMSKKQVETTISEPFFIYFEDICSHLSHPKSRNSFFIIGLEGCSAHF